MSLGLLEEATASHAGWLNERIVAVCASGLVAGPWVGLAVSVFVTWLAVAYHGLPFGSIGPSMFLGGLAGGWLYRWRPRLAQQSLTGFCLASGVSLLRAALLSFYAPHSYVSVHSGLQLATAAVVQGLGTALILAIIGQVRDRDLLRRRLQGLFGRSFQLEVRSEIGEGTTVTMRVPFQKRLAVNLESKRALPSNVSELVPS
jgi:LytS/YehU family sensor histidine kinase